jgi:hypothetical protein
VSKVRNSALGLARLPTSIHESPGGLEWRADLG